MKQKVLANLGRVETLAGSGTLDSLVQSLTKFCEKAAVLSEGKDGDLPVSHVCIGPSLVFERLWRELRIDEAIQWLRRHRKFEFPVERAVFLTVLHRLFDPGSDRAAEEWKNGYAIEGAEPGNT